MMNIRRFVGKLKFYQNRLASYWNVIIAIQVTFLFVITDPLGISRYLWICLIVCLVVGIIFFDHFIVNRDDIDFWLRRSKSYRKLCDDVDYIKRNIRR